MDVQIPPVFYKTSSSFGAEALLTSKATIDKSLLQAGQGYRRPSLAFGRLFKDRRLGLVYIQKCYISIFLHLNQ